MAHGASVNCVSLGHKSGRVLVTGGDDKKVNLWAVGKPNCIMVSHCLFFIFNIKQLDCIIVRSSAVFTHSMGFLPLPFKMNFRCVVHYLKPIKSHVQHGVHY